MLTTFALAQPLFSLLGENPEFFAARGSTASEIIVFAVLLVLVPPLLLLVIELLAGLAGRGPRRMVHLVLVGLLAAVVFLQTLKRAIDAGDAVLVLLGLALGAAAAAAYARAEPVRFFMTVLTPAPLAFLVLFLFISPVHKLTLASEASARAASAAGSRAPVVILGLDELPTTSLLGPDGRVDRERYPGFAELEAGSTWFRNAHSIYDSTSRAWPAILDGDYPSKESLPTSSDHPNSLFAILGKSHAMNVSEEATTICPRNLCKDARLDEPFVDRLRSMGDDLALVYAHVVAPPGIEKELTSVSETWGDFGGDAGGDAGAEDAGGATGGETGEADAGGGADGPNTRENLQANRNKRLDQWIHSIEETRRPSLNFKHVLLPHVPWQYLPSGKQYRRVASEPIPGISRQSYKDPGQVDQLQLRHLLQLGFTDLEVLKLIRHLRRIGLYDEALIVVTADHGVSFKVGQFDRREMNRSNIDEIGPIPLFVKAPGQRKGRIDDSIVETTDILPTIADVLNLRLPAKVDGRSAFSAAVRARRQVKMLKRDLSGWVRLSGAQFDREKREELLKKLRLFGTGAEGPDRVYRIGPNQQLIGRPAAAGGDSAARASVSDAQELRHVDLKSPTAPTWITGRVSGGGSQPRDIAIAVNGTVRGVGRTFRLATGGGELFGVMVPESALRQGKNRVEVLEVTGGTQLRRMGGV
ncbi:MAG: sulfatase-like hydrolase/transferase [Actinomycetota bacterium]|nr:sulfatase-like hydrolase/transferase [Actinomycetota bacterium]